MSIIAHADVSLTPYNRSILNIIFKGIKSYWIMAQNFVESDQKNIENRQRTKLKYCSTLMPCVAPPL